MTDEQWAKEKGENAVARWYKMVGDQFTLRDIIAQALLAAMKRQQERDTQDLTNVLWDRVKKLVGCNLNPTKCKLCGTYNHGIGLDWCVLRPLETKAQAIEKGEP